MSKPPIGPYWFEAITHPDRTSGGAHQIDDGTWLYCIGIGDTTPVALVTGRDDHEACARARLITKALNEARREALAAAQADEDSE